MTAPKQYQSIMVSSTFTDLQAHRQKAINSINKQGFHAEVMEFSGANANRDVLDQSLAMVGHAAAYIGVIGHKYGQSPECPERNPDRKSITELEFDEAMRLGRPILLFIMSDEHGGKRSDFEADPEKLEKLEAFRQRAKQMRTEGKVQRIYEMFDSLEDFAQKAADAIARLTNSLALPVLAPSTPSPPPAETALPLPPALRAMPRYRGSHPFVGRKAQLETLDEWASPANQNPLLLFEAMGGSGKSLLTWHWTTECAERARGDWAGRFWYSFYEKGAVMADFCRQALAYMTGKQSVDFEKQPQSKLTEQLLAQLNARPWLMVLDGLERVLVAYHRADAAQMLDDGADTATDPMGKREPCRAIRREDDDLLAALAGADPSRILISTRLTPLALLSPSNTPIPGVRQELLPGLRPEDAEAMMRGCGIVGDAAKLRAYLQSNCDCHPLVTGVIAGLINKNVRAPGNFDKWVADPKGGGGLNLGALDLKQRRNHILSHAIDGVAGDEAHVLHLLSLYPRAADYDVLLELALKNDVLDEARLQASLDRLREYGLVQYDDDAGGYDLHPVVRGVVAGRMDTATTQAVGEALVDHFTAVPHNPWENARTLDDVQSGIDWVATLLRLQRYTEAFEIFAGDLSNAMLFNIQADTEIQQLLRPFFSLDWYKPVESVGDSEISYILNNVAISIRNAQSSLSRELFELSLLYSIKTGSAEFIRAKLLNFSGNIENTGVMMRLAELSSKITDVIGDERGLFMICLHQYEICVDLGMLGRCDSLYEQLSTMNHDWGRDTYRPGSIERTRAFDLFFRGNVDREFVDAADKLAVCENNRAAHSSLHYLRGLCHLGCNDFESAVRSFDAAILMAHERGRQAHHVEAWRALARCRSDAINEARAIAERLDNCDEEGSIALAELWYELGDQQRALVQAHRAHDWAVGGGEPYVRRYWFDRIRALFDKMGAASPDVPVFDPDAHPPYAWEADIHALIEKTKARRSKLRR